MLCSSMCRYPYRGRLTDPMEYPPDLPDSIEDLVDLATQWLARIWGCLAFIAVLLVLVLLTLWIK